MKKITFKDIMEDILLGTFGVVFMGWIIVAGIAIGSEIHTQKTYGPERYEIVITDTTIDQGFAGRTKYRVEYKYRTVNRPDDEYASMWKIQTTKVDWTEFDRYQIGKRFRSDTYLL